MGSAYNSLAFGHTLRRNEASRGTVLRLAALALVALGLAGCGVNRGYQATNDRECLARVMYFESNRSSEDGMLAVGTVVMNRLQSGRYPHTICGVVGQFRQFAPGALSLPWGGRSRDRATMVADQVIRGARHRDVGGAMFFHTAGLTFPYRNMHYVAVAGGNAFYEKRSPAEMRAFAAAEPQVQPQPEPTRLALLTPRETLRPAPRVAPLPFQVKAPEPGLQPEPRLQPETLAVTRDAPDGRLEAPSGMLASPQAGVDDLPGEVGLGDLY